MPVVWTAPMMRPSHARSRRMNAAHAVSASRRATLSIVSDLGVRNSCASVAMSGPFDPGREAAARCIVRVDRLDLWVGEEIADSGVGLARLGKNGVGHHSVLVEAAQRQDSGLEHRRNPIDIFGRLLV